MVDKFAKHDAVIVIDGPYSGWVGYFQEYIPGGYAQALLMDGSGESDIQELDIEAIKNIVQPWRGTDPVYDEPSEYIFFERAVRVAA